MSIWRIEALINVKLNGLGSSVKIVLVHQSQVKLFLTLSMVFFSILASFLINLPGTARLAP